jgi:hypothetical protein
MTTTVGRKRKSKTEVGVTVRLPANVVANLDRFARDEFATRAAALVVLIERGLERGDNAR